VAPASQAGASRIDSSAALAARQCGDDLLHIVFSGLHYFLAADPILLIRCKLACIVHAADST